MVLPLRTRKYVMVIGDLLLMYTALALTIGIRNMGLDEILRLENHLFPFTFVFIFWTATFYISGFYDQRPKQTSFLKEFTNTLVVFAINVLVTVAIFYLLRSFYLTPKTVLAIFALLYFALFLGWRWSFRTFLAQRVGRVGVGFIGWDETLVELLSGDDALGRVGCTPVFVYAEIDRLSPELSGISHVRTIPELQDSFDRLKIDVVVTSIDLRTSEPLERLLFSHLNGSTTYMSIPVFFEWVTRRIPVNAINRFWFLDQLDMRGKAAYGHIKRFSDLLLASALLIATLPVWPLIWLVIRLESTGPAFFKQTRCGIQDRCFTIYKFRTMRVENNDHKMTAEKDNRITPFGRFLRKTRLDELPQLLNILKGQMSFVGPRPERPEIVAELERQVPFYRQRTLVIPGLTGWDQVSGEYHSATPQDSLKKLQYDLYYIKNRSLVLDFTIMLKTVAIVFSRQGR